MTILQRIRGFFITLGKSCYDMELYRRVRSGSWTGALAYAAIFFALLSVALTLAAIPGSYKLLGDLEKGIGEQIPDGAAIETKDGQFSTTMAPGTEFGGEDFVVAVDGGVFGKDFPQSFEGRTGVLIGRDAVFSQDEDGSREIMPLEGAPNVKLTKEMITGWVASYGPLAVAGLLFMFLGMHYSFTLMGALVYVAVYALLALAVGRLWKVRLEYRQWFAVGLHAITLPTLIDYLFGFLDLNVPFAFTVVFFMFMVAVIADEKARPVKKVGRGAPFGSAQGGEGAEAKEGTEAASPDSTQGHDAGKI